MQVFAVFYARCVDDKEDGVYISGVHFGGIGATQEEAGRIARECVNTIRGGTIIPKIEPVTGQHQLRAAMVAATKKFIVLENQMFEAEDILSTVLKRQ